MNFYSLNQICQRGLFVEHHKKNIKEDYMIKSEKVGSGSFGKIYLGQKKFPKSSWRAIKLMGKNKINSDKYLLKEIETLLVLVHFFFFDTRTTLM